MKKSGTTLGYQFNNPHLLRMALTHRSHSMPHNERLEFLGDSLLNCVISARLYNTYPDLSEGELSRLRAHFVQEQALCKIAGELNLSPLLMLGEGEVKSGGAQRASILADTVEALVGAVYLDGGFDKTQAWVNDLFDKSFANIDPLEISKDPKTLLQEYVQSKKIDLPIYTITTTHGQAHQQIFVVECKIAALGIQVEGEGSSRRNAEQAAAKKAYQLIRK